VRNVISNPDDAILTLTIVNLAHSMRLKVVGEGVETREQLNFLRLHGCDEMQGFYFARPLDVEACTQALTNDRRLQVDAGQPSDERPALLIVDDNEQDLALLERALASSDFQILTATSPAAGFEMLARHGAAIVVSDYQMPGMSGVTFLANVRKLYPDAVRIVATGGDPPTLTSAVNSAGIHKYLSKNWEPERLRAELREAYRQQQ
jgi:CheY-like chemotaxis protein